MRKWLVGVLIVAASLNLAGCGYNKLQEQDESVKAAWSEVVNQYQRRADLIPNLVEVVRGYAAQEERVLVQVTEARAKATSIQVTPEVLNDPETFKRFQQAQSQLTVALGGLMRAVEAYPDLKSNANFRDLQVQIEGTENRITVARNRYIEAVKAFNVTVRSFPTNLTAGMFDFEAKPNFSVENEAEIARPPEVKFDNSTPAQQAAPVESAPKPAGSQ
jgi:LemA protein